MEEPEGLFNPNTALFQKPYLATLWPLLRPTYSEPFAEWFEERYGLLAHED